MTRSPDSVMVESILDTLEDFMMAKGYDHKMNKSLMEVIEDFKSDIKLKDW